jgi:hypothetical protein
MADHRQGIEPDQARGIKNFHTGMLRTSLAGKFKSQRKCATACFHESNKQSYESCRVANCFYPFLRGQKILPGTRTIKTLWNSHVQTL